MGGCQACEQINSLAEFGFFEHEENVLFLGFTDPMTYCNTFIYDCRVYS